MALSNKQIKAIKYAAEAFGYYEEGPQDVYVPKNRYVGETVTVYPDEREAKIALSKLRDAFPEVLEK